MINKIKEVKCEKCNQVWGTKSTRIFVTCPNCLNKVRIIKEEKKNAIQEQ